ncbi:hypothetical protein B0H67DRAFT_554939 [Lasiosphaeris hirsuta]|uniref:Erythromycin esterase n=1 Tax=Lasiosphaeris hirsuta TaxID=260670 RepID=A0AA40A7X3_9PEZI|nr:hypothetical protein B0H67DRAFT_554939 [Lasiosphaeris hirsuta]
MARRSARLARSSKTHKPEEPSLASVAERDDSPQVGAPQSLDAIVSSPAPGPKTPKGSSPAKPPMFEMHPSRVHQTMAPPSSGLRHGFTDIKPIANRDDNFPAAAQSTPSKIGTPSTSAFTFRFTREASDLKLGPDAQRMMDELRGEALKIKADLVAKREAEKGDEEEVNSRKIAPAKGRAGRFSAAHIAQFKKMDSIANHPSAFRASPAKITPFKAGIKRSQSKANLDDSETPRAKPSTPVYTTSKIKAPAFKDAPSQIKRARQHIDDDASSNRPVSRDASSLPRPKSAAGPGPAIPRPKSSFASLMTPTKSSLSRTASLKTPVHGSLAKSPAKSTLSGIPRSATTNNLAAIVQEVETTEKAEKAPEPSHAEVKSPTSRFDRVKSMFRGHKPTPAKVKSALPIPLALAPKSPAAARPDNVTLAVPLATPSRKLTKRVAFTPDTQRAALAQDSPSPVKSGIPRSKSRQVLGEVSYPTLDSVMAKEKDADPVFYPDLSARRPLPEPPVKAPSTDSAGPSAPSAFTFRSDHTIDFGSASPTSFGSSPGQASVRPVRPSIMPTENMPGSFPASILISSPNKENEAPRTTFLTLPHGMGTKKRNRASTDEEDAEVEAAQRAAKKRKQEMVPEGDALLAPKLTGAHGGRPINSPKKLLFATTPSSARKRAGISLSRLNMLSRPKLRK